MLDNKCFNLARTSLKILAKLLCLGIRNVRRKAIRAVGVSVAAMATVTAAVMCRPRVPVVLGVSHTLLVDTLGFGPIGI